MNYSTPQVSKEYQKIVSQLEIKLGSNDKSPNNLRDINYLQRSLSDMAIEVYKNPDFFTGQKVNDICDLLEQAGKYLQGTIYETRALERPNEFRPRVDSLKKAAEATKKLRERAA